jgi:hypothetical protein
MGAGMIARNHLGVFLVGCRECLERVVVSEYAKTLALRSATVLAQDEDYNKVILATDCFSMIHPLLSSTLDRSPSVLSHEESSK